MFSKLIFLFALIALGNACTEREAERRLNGCSDMLGQSCWQLRRTENCILSVVEDCLDDEQKRLVSGQMSILRSSVRDLCGYKK